MRDLSTNTSLSPLSTCVSARCNKDCHNAYFNEVTVVNFIVFYLVLVRRGATMRPLKTTPCLGSEWYIFFSLVALPKPHHLFPDSPLWVPIHAGYREIHHDESRRRYLYGA